MVTFDKTILSAFSSDRERKTGNEEEIKFIKKTIESSNSCSHSVMKCMGFGSELKVIELLQT